MLKGMTGTISCPTLFMMSCQSELGRSEQPQTAEGRVSRSSWPLTRPAATLSPAGGEGPPDGGPGEGVAADEARVFSVDGVVRCIIWVTNLTQV